MGNSLNGCYLCAKNNDSVVILLAGLDNAGKTRTVGLLVGNGAGSEAPTIGFQPTELDYRGRKVHLHDVGGSDQFRAAWKHYYVDAHGLIFVVDSADRERFAECAEVLEEVLSHPHITGKPVLILANKQDLNDAIDDLDIVEKLNIEQIVNRYRCPARVESYAATVPKGKDQKHYIDPGLKKGYEWLLNYVIHKYTEINLRVKNDLIRVTNQSKPHKNIETANDETSKDGFENPNYKIDIVREESEGEDSIIIVKEVSDKEIKTNGNVKLSPLFGNKNETEDSRVKSIELEARTQITKLTPISKHRVFIAPSIEKKMNPHTPQTANEIFIEQLKSFKSQDSLSDIKSMTEDGSKQSYTASAKQNFTEVSLGDSGNSDDILPNVKVESCRRFLPPIKGVSTKNTSTPVKDNNLASNNVSELNERPKSASESVKMQLENVNNSGLRRKLGIKGINKNKTSPEEDTNLFIFDPNNKNNINNEIAVSRKNGM